MIAAEAAAQAITSLELVVREKELMLELAEIKHDEEKEKMVRPLDPSSSSQMDEKLTPKSRPCCDGFAQTQGFVSAMERMQEANAAMMQPSY